jgi:hypothetical protein
VALKPETTVAYLNGELDMSTASCLTIRSARQRALRELQRDATAAGGSVSLTDVPDLVSELLGDAGMLNRIAIVGERT